MLDPLACTFNVLDRSGVLRPSPAMSGHEVNRSKGLLCSWPWPRQG